MLLRHLSKGSSFSKEGYSWYATVNCSLSSVSLLRSPNFIDHGSCFFHSCTQVSHDEHLISGSVGELWAVSEGKVTPFPGSFQDYKKLLKSFV